jgi:hypothetical protein
LPAGWRTIALFNTMLNAQNPHQAAWALTTELKIPRLQAGRLIEAVERRHSRISEHFVKMMRIESDIMTEVVLNLLIAGIPVPPIHDAALIQAKHYGHAEAEMIAAFERRADVAAVTVCHKS